MEVLAPCGLDCARCARYAGGEIRDLSARLRDALVGFENMAPKISGMVPAMKDYNQFLEVLAFFTRADCVGCRAGGSQLPFCGARTCFKEKGVDFCFQCEEYPCGRNQYPPNLADQWRAFNDRMKDVGVERFYREQKSRPRYFRLRGPAKKCHAEDFGTTGKK